MGYSDKVRAHFEKNGLSPTRAKQIENENAENIIMGQSQGWPPARTARYVLNTLNWSIANPLSNAWGAALGVAAVVGVSTGIWTWWNFRKLSQLGVLVSEAQKQDQLQQNASTGG